MKAGMKVRFDEGRRQFLECVLLETLIVLPDEWKEREVKRK